MNQRRTMRLPQITAAILSLATLGAPARAQTQPAMIPTVLANAMAFGPAEFGKPQYFVGTTPSNWPAALVPAGAKVIGGSVFGDTAMFQMRTAVFAFSQNSNPSEVLRSLLTRAGYVRNDPELGHSGGGFIGSLPPTSDVKYCNGSTMAAFDVVDSVQDPLVVAVHLLDGEAGRQNCAQPRIIPGRLPLTVPRLTPPSGAVSLGGGSSWGGNEGSITSALRTTLSVDSIRAHYTRQLVAGGWKLEGSPAMSDGVAVQRFSVREGNDVWSAALVILAAGERRELRILFSKAE